MLCLWGFLLLLLHSDGAAAVWGRPMAAAMVSAAGELSCMAALEASKAVSLAAVGPAGIGYNHAVVAVQGQCTALYLMYLPQLLQASREHAA